MPWSWLDMLGGIFRRSQARRRQIEDPVGDGGGSHRGQEDRRKAVLVRRMAGGSEAAPERKVFLCVEEGE
jgi:hypothetical protein